MAVIRKGKGMTLIQLIRNAQQYEAWDRPKTDGLRKRESRLKLAKTEVLPNIKFKDVLVNVLHTKPYALRFYTHILNENKDGRYPAYIDFMMAGKGTKVQLNCGCYDNWGRANYANYKAGVSFQHTSDGKKQNSKNKMKLPFMCVAKNTLVTTVGGDKHIQDIVEGDSVLTLKGYKRVTKAWQSGTKSVVRVTTSGGHSMDITPDHRVFTFKDNKFQYTEIRNLAKGDYLFQVFPAWATNVIQYDHLAGMSHSEMDQWDKANGPNTEQNEYLRDVVSSNALTKTIESIKFAGDSEVYDLEVEGAHHFLANGFVVHNCKHLHAFSFKLLQEKMLNTDLTLAPEVLRVAKNTIAQLEAKKRKSQKKWTDTFEELFTGTPQKVSPSTKLKPDTK